MRTGASGPPTGSIRPRTGGPYLDGSGNSFTGALGSYQESQTYTRQENGGDVKKETVEVSISIKAVPPAGGGWWCGSLTERAASCPQRT